MIRRISCLSVVSFFLFLCGCNQINPVGGTGTPTWTQVDTGIWDQNVGHVTSVALFAHGSNLFAGTDSGVYLSTDQGAHWRSRNTGLPEGYLRYIRSFAASGSHLFAGASQGVFSSTNDGENWVAANNGLPSTPVSALIVVGSDLLAATTGGVYRSTDNGLTWKASNGGPNPSAILAAFQGLGAKLFAGGYDGIFVSTDQGHHWTLTDSLFAGHRPMVTSFAISGSNMFVGLYAVGVYVSADTGISWSPSNNGLADFGVTSFAVSGTRLYAGTAGGVYVSTNNGSTWTSIGLREPTGGVQSLAISGQYLFAGTSGLHGGVWRYPLQ